MDLRVLKNITYGMYIISTSYNDELVGCVVNTVTQITSENPIISVSINKLNYTNEILKKSKKIAITILSEKTNKDTIVEFGYKSSKDINKFTNINYEIVNDIPVISDNICGYILGNVIDIIDTETHDIFLIRITDTLSINDYIPMTYDYYHNNLKGTSPRPNLTDKKS